MQDRIETLEIKVAYVEKAVADLDDVVRELATEIERLRQDMLHFTQSIQEMMKDERYDPAAEVPPHY